MYYRVIPFARTFDTYGLIYKVPDNFKDAIKPGKIVLVPFKKSFELALCYWEVWEDELNCQKEDIKNIEHIHSDFEFLWEKYLEIISYIAQRYFAPIHHCVWLFFPKNLVEKIQKDTYQKIKISEYSYSDTELQLSDSQKDIYENIVSKEKHKHLVYGVTGSGKTQIYMKLIEDNLKEWKQTLLLIPEIILTSQIGERIVQVFGQDVVILHSGVSAAKKSKYWMDIYHGNAKIIIGTRSSLFYPYKDLGTIIIDEEHDKSYISDSVPRYHTLDVAERISEKFHIPLVLWSGTPLATTLYRWLRWDFEVHQLLEVYK